jgi:hypothetical protein
MNRLAIFLLSAALSCWSMGCAPAAWSAIGKVAQVSQMLGSLIDYADNGQRTYFDRHPNMEAEALVKEKLSVARSACAVADAALAVAHAVDDGDVVKAKAEALKAYGELRAVLEQLGIISATPPAGGAETGSPKPKPLKLPTVAEIADIV